MLGTSFTHVFCRYQKFQNHISKSSFAYLFRLASNNKGKYSELFIGYIDETRYVGSRQIRIIQVFCCCLCADYLYLYIFRLWFANDNKVMGLNYKFGMWVVVY